MEKDVKETITSYRQFLKITEQERPYDKEVVISFGTLMELRVKLENYQDVVNTLKAKTKYRDVQLMNMKQKIKAALTAQQYNALKKELNSVPGEFIKVKLKTSFYFYFCFLDVLVERLKKSETKVYVIQEDFTPEMKKFIVTLHYKSPAAYKFVRETFNNVIPHARTIRRWYCSIDASPGQVNHMIS